ncbi:MAG: hypothetical protein AB7W37_12980 [Syntrophobacteraceae bacterium]
MRKSIPDKTLLAALAVLAVLCFLPRPVALCRAADWSFSSSVNATESYDSNVRFRSYNEEDDFVTSIQPKASLKGQTDQTLFQLDADLTGEKYINNTDLDGIYTNDEINLNHKWSEALETDVNTFFIRDSTLEDELQESGVQSVKADRNRYGFGLTQIWAPWETFSVSLGGDAAKTVYPDGERSDLTYWELSLGPKWSLNERDLIGANIYYQNQDYSDDTSIRNAGGLLYWQRQFDETTAFSLGAGYRLTWNEYTTGGWGIVWTNAGYRLKYMEEEEDETDDGFLFLATLNKRWTEAFNTSLSLKRDQYSSTDARSYERNQAVAHLHYKMSDITALDCDLNYSLNTVSGTESEDAEDVNYLCVTPAVTRRLAEDLYIQVAGSYTHQTDDYDSGDDATTERYKTWIMFTYSWPRLWENH